MPTYGVSNTVLASLFAGQTGDRLRSARLVDAVEEGGGAKGESALAFVHGLCKVGSWWRKPLFSTEGSALSPVMTGGEEWRCRGGSRGREYVATYRDSGIVVQKPSTWF